MARTASVVAWLTPFVAWLAAFAERLAIPGGLPDQREARLSKKKEGRG